MSDSRSFYLALTPWLAFAVADRSSGIGPVASGVLAAGLGLCLVAVDVAHRRWRPIPVVAVLLFAGLAAFSWVAGGDPRGAALDRSLSVALLAAVFALSLVGKPAMDPYADGDPDGSTVATRRWALVFGAVAASAAVGAVVSASWGPTIFNWLLPMFLIGGAVLRTAGGRADGEEAGVPVLLEGLVETHASPRLRVLASEQADSSDS